MFRWCLMLRKDKGDAQVILRARALVCVCVLLVMHPRYVPDAAFIRASCILILVSDASLPGVMHLPYA